MHRDDRRGAYRRLLAHVMLPAACVAAAAVLVAAYEPLPQDRGAAGAWQRLQKLRTTASALHTTAHPDDEHGGMLAQLSRGRGARVSLLTLTRGESGDNAIGPELFDALGLIRTEELVAADRYYGVDAQYFTTVVDYGFSKRLEEAMEKWGRENVLRDVVRVIRVDRPFVVIARFQGNERDGHGNHQAAGLITQEAFRAAGDPTVFPEQIAAGLRAWQPLKLYMGGVRANEDWTLKVDADEYSPWLGTTYQAFARTGLALQRSQNGGRVSSPPGGSAAYYKRLAVAPRVAASKAGAAFDAAIKEKSFFDGIDTALPGLFSALGRPEPAGARELLAAIDREAASAAQQFSMTNPSASVPALARGLATTRKAIAVFSAEADVVFTLNVKEQQFVDAINAALGIELEAMAQAPGPLVSGQLATVDVSLTNRSPIPIGEISVGLVADAAWEPTALTVFDLQLSAGQALRKSLTVTVPADAPPTRPYFDRASIAESRYRIADGAQAFKPAADPPVAVRARYTVDGVPIEARAVVRRREPHLPYGEELRELTVVPALAVNVTPRVAIVPLAAARKTVDLAVEVVNNAERGGSGRLTLTLPDGWTASPAAADLAFARAGERALFHFAVSPAGIEGRSYRVAATATFQPSATPNAAAPPDAGRRREFTEGYQLIEHRDLEARYLYRPAALEVRGVDVAIAPNLRVGYVMGIGDDVPDAIAQLGASVTLLSEHDLAAGDLRRYDAIVTGTRAYAVRDDLRRHNRRLLDYVRQGGNLVVLYNTQELVPNEYAPYPGELTARAEEVSEEDSPVEILAAQHPLLNRPNRIGPKDFDGWIEQRGSKFFSSWDRAYVPVISTHDTGQSPQQGGWLVADYGNGHYTYFAYALHRQLPYGVPGAYRLLANLLSLGK